MTKLGRVRESPTQIRKNCPHSKLIQLPWAANGRSRLHTVFQGGKRSERNLGKLFYVSWLIINHFLFD